jgi:hypothetical protein
MLFGIPLLISAWSTLSRQNVTFGHNLGQRQAKPREFAKHSAIDSRSSAPTR